MASQKLNDVFQKKRLWKVVSSASVQDPVRSSLNSALSDANTTNSAVWKTLTADFGVGATVAFVSLTDDKYWYDSQERRRTQHLHDETEDYTAALTIRSLTFSIGIFAVNTGTKIFYGQSKVIADNEKDMGKPFASITQTIATAIRSPKFEPVPDVMDVWEPLMEKLYWSLPGDDSGLSED